MTPASVAASLLAGLSLSASVDSWAHEGATSYLDLEQSDRQIELSWDVPLADVGIDPEIRLDGNADGNVTWGEVVAARDTMHAGIVGRARISTGAATCTEAERRLPSLADHHGIQFVRLVASFTCPESGVLRADLTQTFERDRSHRVILSTSGAGSGPVAMLTSDAPLFEARPGAKRVAGRFFAQGILHLLSGYDHLAFLLVLLLAVVRKRDGLRPTLAAAARDAIKVVTAFTVAHSLTLAAAAFGLVRLPPGPVEAAIAASVLVAAVASLSPRGQVHGAALAFGFGLVHGLGFANVLAELLTETSTLLAVGAFNLGIEIAQIAIAMVALPLLWWLSGRKGVIGKLLPATSLGVACLAAVWFLERL